MCYRFPLLLVVQRGSTVVSGPTLCVTYSRCYQWSNTLRYIFPLLSAVQHFVLHISTVISGPTLCVTYFHCYQRSNTVCYRFSLLSAVQHFCYRFSLLSAVQHCVLHIPTVISGPTLCVTGFHCYQRFNTLCYIFPLLSAVQHCVLQVSTVISGPTLSQPPP